MDIESIKNPKTGVLEALEDGKDMGGFVEADTLSR